MKKAILFVLILFSGLHVFSQSNKHRYLRAINYEPYTYFGLNMGVNGFMGEDFSNYVSQRLFDSYMGYSFGLVYGYQFSPAWGARFLMGPEQYNWPYGKSDSLSINTMNLSLESTLSLSYLLAGYDMYRNTDFDFVAGLVGLLRYEAGSAPLRFYPGISTGLQMNHWLTDMLRVHLQAGVIFTADPLNLNPVTGFEGSPVDFVPTVKLGFSFVVPGVSSRINRVKMAEF